jgi:uncharacterized membrane protein YciS (DUF1049 family)
VRNALILLVVVALSIVALGAANGSVAFDFDVVFGTLTAVSLTWVAAAVAAVVLVAGLAAAWLAQADASRTRRRLEVELQSTYERLRAAEAKLPQEPPEAAQAPEPHDAAETPGPRDLPESLTAAPQGDVGSGVDGEGGVSHAG